MAMDIKESFSRLRESDEYKSWKQSHPGFNLTSAFYISGSKDDHWQFGFSDNSFKKSFIFEMGEKIGLEEQGEMIRLPDNKICELGMDKLDMELIDILDEIEKVRKEKYPSILPLKKLIILQKINDVQEWNITLVGDSFKTINFKVDSQSGKIKEHKLVSMVDGM